MEFKILIVHRKNLKYILFKIHLAEPKKVEVLL